MAAALEQMQLPLLTGGYSSQYGFFI